MIKKRPGLFYTTSSYGNAIEYAIKKGNEHRQANDLEPIPHWHPHQLRHNAATLYRREHGLEVARILLGHKTAAITEIYAEADRAKAIDVMAKIG